MDAVAGFGTAISALAIVIIISVLALDRIVAFRRNRQRVQVRDITRWGEQTWSEVDHEPPRDHVYPYVPPPMPGDVFDDPPPSPEPAIPWPKDTPRATPAATWLPIVTSMGESDPQHVRILGATSDGKSYLAEVLATVLTGSVIIIDPVWKPGNWSGMDAVTVDDDGEFRPIEACLQGVLAVMKERNGKLKLGVTSFPRLTIIFDEVPDTVSETSNAGLVIKRLGQRGRHVNIHLIGLAQSDRVGSWGLDGYGDSFLNFIDIRLGAKAIEMAPEAAELQRPAVLSWRGLLKARYGLSDPLLIDLSSLPKPDAGKLETFTLPVVEEERSLTPVAQRVLDYLVAWEGELPPSKNRIQQRVGSGYNQVSNALLLLQQQGFIDARYRPILGGGEAEEVAGGEAEAARRILSRP